MTNRDWTQADFDIIRALALDGKPASEIGARFGVTRNAIIGVCRRRGIKLLGGPGRSKRSADAPVLKTLPHRHDTPEEMLSRIKARSAPISLPAADPLTNAPPPVAFSDLDGTQCAWPVGDDAPGPGMACCGLPVVDRYAPEGKRAKRWCQGHIDGENARVAKGKKSRRNTNYALDRNGQSPRNRPPRKRIGGWS